MGNEDITPDLTASAFFEIPNAICTRKRLAIRF